MSSSYRQPNYKFLTWAVLFLGLIVRVILSSQFLLVTDEVNYWQWSRYLDLGYQDHPPMIAWTIWLSTLLFGQNELAVRLPTNIGVTVAFIFMSLLAARMFTWKTAFHTALLNQGILLFIGAALITTPDGMLLPCWAGATYFGALALRENKTRYWLATGIWFGLGLLSKYTMLLFLPSLLLCIICIQSYQNRLFQPAPWLGLLLGFILFTPVILWNSANEWATFRHVLHMGGINSRSFLTVKYVGDFLGEQLAILSPVVFWLILVAWKKYSLLRGKIAESHQFLVWTSLPTFIIFLLLSLHSRVYGNWPAAGYLTAVILVAAIFGKGGHKSVQDSPGRSWKWAVWIAYCITLPIMIQVVYPVLPVPVKYDRTARESVGWDTLGKNVHNALESSDNLHYPFIFGLRYQIASEMAFYIPGQPETVSLNRWNRPNVYDYWFNDKMLVNRDAIGVLEHEDSIERLQEIFASVELERKVPVIRHSPWFGDELVTTFYIVRAYGFKGGQRWKPREEDDIRATRKQTDG